MSSEMSNVTDVKRKKVKCTYSIVRILVYISPSWLLLFYLLKYLKVVLGIPIPLRDTQLTVKPSVQDVGHGRSL